MMQKFSVAILFLLLTSMAVKAQQVIYTQTFEDTASLFQDYVLSNFDKADPIGTEWDTLKSVPWFVHEAGTSINHAAIATSDYLADTAANDWFVMPAIRIGKASKLTWKSLSLTNGKTDTYQVYVSTSEQSASGCLFNGPAGSFTSNNTTSFVSETLDLAEAGYANQYIFIGFRLNTPSGGGLLAIDDLVVTEDSTHFVSLNFIVDMSKYISDSLFFPSTDTVDIAGTFNNFDGTKHILKMVPGTDSTIYAIRIPGFLDADHLEFKFRINSTWNDSTVEFPYGQPNRVWVIEPGKYTYTCFYNNDDGSTYNIPESGIMDLVNVFPNPAQSMVWIRIPKNIEKLSLVNLTGQKILDRDTPSGNIINLDVSILSKGTYIVLFYTRQGFAGSKKLIKN